MLKIFVIVVMLGIAASLVSAGIFLVKDRGASDRTARALTWRIGLSLALFLFLMAGHYFGLIQGRL